MLCKDHKSLVYLTSCLIRYFTILNGTDSNYQHAFKHCNKEPEVYPPLPILCAIPIDMLHV